MKLLLISPRDAYATARLMEEAVRQGIELVSVDIVELTKNNYSIGIKSFGALYVRQAYLDFGRRVSTEELRGLIELVRKFREAGKVVVDASIADGDLGQGKYESLQRLQQQGIAVPRTTLLKENSSFPDGKGIPCIAKWNYGFGGKHTYLIKTQNDLDVVKQKYPAEEILIQEFIPAEWEYKVITSGYKSLPVIIKLPTNHNKFLPDLSQPQILSVNDAPEVVKIAEQSARILHRELAKVDILQAGDSLYVLEVNRWPGLQYFEKTTHFNVAGAFLHYIQTRVSRAL